MKYCVLFFSLQYNTETRQFRDRPRITVSVPGFGGTDSVEFLGFVPYLETFVSYFVDRGYERGKSIRAAPYDWRLAAGTVAQLYENRTWLCVRV